MKYVVYISTARNLFTDEELVDLLEKSRTNNSMRFVSGILLYHDGALFQILEGDQQVVDNLYEKIFQDVRHHSVLKMFEGFGETRFFKDWSMAFRKITSAEWNEVQGYVDPLNLRMKYTDDANATTEIMTLLQSFANANFMRLD